MIRADEVRQGTSQIQFSLAALEGTRLQSKTFGKRKDLPVAMPAVSRGEINLSGSQLLVGLTSALCVTGLLFWAFLRLWLFDH